MVNKTDWNSHLLNLYEGKPNGLKEFNPTRSTPLNSKNAEGYASAIMDLFSNYKIDQHLIDAANKLFKQAEETSIWNGLSMSLESSEKTDELRKLAKSAIEAAEDLLKIANK
jgi:hypothetical protein